ncbi:hypothetical protein HDV03_004990 [Kappamyces sp. JEL0829]|nr:hypothetical protein HDV03_004990 [Kappamyces sp. JEL0829]
MKSFTFVAVICSVIASPSQSDPSPPYSTAMAQASESAVIATTDYGRPSPTKSGDSTGTTLAPATGPIYSTAMAQTSEAPAAVTTGDYAHPAPTTTNGYGSGATSVPATGPAYSTAMAQVSEAPAAATYHTDTDAPSGYEYLPTIASNPPGTTYAIYSGSEKIKVLCGMSLLPWVLLVV